MKWFPLVGGIIALLAGFYLFINPVTVVATLGWFIALFIFIYGISNLVRYLQADSYHRSPWYLVQSILAIIFGIILLVQPTLSAAIIGRFVAFILIAIGASAIYTFTRINY